MTSASMPAEEFWSIVERTADADRDPDSQMRTLRMLLQGLSLEKIISFEVAFRRYLNEAYSWDLWGAATVINGDCSSDRFEYFRRWLVWRGRKIYEAALVDPDSLAGVDATGEPRREWEFENIYYVAVEVFEEMGGEGDVRDHSDPEADCLPSGQHFEEDEEHLARRYPKLWHRFGQERRVDYSVWP